MSRNKEIGLPITEQSFKELFDEYYPSLYHYAQRLVKNDEVADDITQEVFVDVWNKREEVTLYSVAGFLYTSVRFKCMNHLRSLKRQVHERIDEDATLTDEVDDRLYIIEEEMMREIRKVFSSMPEQRQKVFKMYMDGYSQQEIAEELGVSINTVKTHKLKAKQFLRQELKQTLFILAVTMFNDALF